MTNPKTLWPPGPWCNEPDELDWKDERTGLSCAIRRSMLTGSLNGYVGITPTHPFFGWQLNDDVPLQQEDLDGAVGDVGVVPAFCYALRGGSKHGTIPLGLVLHCHMGITYADEGYDGMATGLWWFGFDCGHAGDLCPLLPMMTDGKYRDIEYVKKEVTHLAWQLRKLETRKLIKPNVKL